MRILFVPILFLLPVFSFSQDGTIDISFGSSGYSSYTPPPGNIYNDINKTVVLPDNRILQCFSVYNSTTNNYDFALARYDSDGQLDPNFDGDSGNDDGIVLTDFGADEVATALAIQHDGKIVVVGYKITAGTRQFAIARYNTDGTLDQSFDGNSSGNGKITTTIGLDDAAYSVAVSATRIVVAGYSYTAVAQSDIAVAVYNVADGTPDNTFSTDGIQTTVISGLQDVAYCVRIQSDSKIVAAGYSFDLATRTFALVRYTSTGNLDTSFDTDGIVTTSVGAGGYDEAYDITILPGGNILAVGSSNNGTSNDFAMVRYTAAGALDISLNGSGMKTYSFGAGDDIAYSALVQTDGKFIVAGTSDNGFDYDFAIARFTSTGNLDNSFNSGAISPVTAGTNVIDFGGDDFGYAIAKQNANIIFGGVTGVSTAMTRLNNTASYLPVRLFSFTAKKQRDVVELNWQTSLEENSSHFEIERSSDGKQFSKLGYVLAAGNSNKEKNYQFTDIKPLQPANFYRLKIVDADGKFSYSNVLVVKLEKKPGVSVFPNPSSGILNVQVSDAASIDLSITDAVGRTLKNSHWKAGQLQFNTVLDLSSLKPGIYFIKVNEETIRFIKE